MHVQRIEAQDACIEAYALHLQFLRMCTEAQDACTEELSYLRALILQSLSTTEP